MLSYLEFLIENKLTLSLYFSTELKKLLNNISKSSQPGYEIAKYLLSCHNLPNKRYEMTFVDITDKNDKISFLQVNRAKRFFDENGDKKKIDDWAFDQWYNKTLNMPGKVWKEQRSEIGIGKFTNKIYQNDKKSITSKELENFVNLYKSFYDLENKSLSRFEVVSGEDIKKWYLNENYAEQKGQLGSSCMRHKSCQNYFGIYTQNPEVVSLVILKSPEDDTKIVGRALLWKSVKGNKIMDRVYFINDSDKILFEKFAEKNGWISKEDMTWEELEKNQIQLKKWKFDYYPYLDTFCFLNKSTGLLSTDEDLWPGQGYIRLQSTGGYFDDDDVVWDDYNEEYIPREDAAYCQRSGEWVNSENAIWLEYRDEYAHPGRDETCYSKYDDSNYYLDDCIFSEILNDYFLSDDVIEIVIDKHAYNDYVHVDLKNSLVDIEIGGTTYKTLDLLTMINPITGVRGFKENVIKEIKNDYEIVSDDELNNYIRNLDIDLNLNDLNIISNYIDDYHIINQFKSDKNEFVNIIKLLLITSPKKGERSMDNINRNAQKDEIYSKLKEDTKRRIKSYFSSFSLNYLKLSESLLIKILKDPQMLVSYITKKKLTYSDLRKLVI
jgi:hypothetical protein